MKKKINSTDCISAISHTKLVCRKMKFMLNEKFRLQKKGKKINLIFDIDEDKNIYMKNDYVK